MKLDDFKRLKKFMMMTTSPNDHEAMGALKMANLLLEREGLTWERVLDRSIKVVAEFEVAPEDHFNDPDHGAKARRALDEAFEILGKKDLRGNFADMIDDIHEKYKKGWALTAKQRAVIMKAAYGE